MNGFCVPCPRKKDSTPTSRPRIEPRATDPEKLLWPQGWLHKPGSTGLEPAGGSRQGRTGTNRAGIRSRRNRRLAGRVPKCSRSERLSWPRGPAAAAGLGLGPGWGRAPEWTRSRAGSPGRHGTRWLASPKPSCDHPKVGAPYVSADDFFSINSEDATSPNQLGH